MTYIKTKIFFPAVLLIAISCSDRQEQYLKPGLEGTTLPEFKIQLSNSDYLHSRDITTNKPMIFFYFSPVCPHCRVLAKDMIKHKELLSTSQIYMITFTGLTEANKFKNDLNLDEVKNLEVGIDFKNSFYNFFLIKGVPYIAIYDSHKKFAAQFTGKITTETLKKAIN